MVFWKLAMSNATIKNGRIVITIDMITLEQYIYIYMYTLSNYVYIIQIYIYIYICIYIHISYSAYMYTYMYMCPLHACPLIPQRHESRWTNKNWVELWLVKKHLL